MIFDVLLAEDGSKLLKEDGSGHLIIEPAHAEDDWDYLLDLDTGNPPTQSNWQCQSNGSVLAGVVAGTNLTSQVSA